MTQTANAFSKADSLSQYFREISNHELLTRNQEKKLARRYLNHADEAAAERLVRANLRLVVKIAKKYHNQGDRYALNDLVQEGNVGLVHAVRHYDPDKKTKFSYYAAYWIRAYILSYLMKNYSSVKIGTTQSQRKLFFNLKKTKEKLRRKGVPTTADQIARYVGVKTSEVEEMEQRMNQNDKSLNAPLRIGDHGQLIDHLKVEDESLEETIAGEQMHQLVRNLLARFKPSLDGREQDILNERIVAEEPLTLKKLGDRYGVSRERIRQIEANIIRKLRNFFRTEVSDFHLYMAG